MLALHTRQPTFRILPPFFHCSYFCSCCAYYAFHFSSSMCTFTRVFRCSHLFMKPRFFSICSYCLSHSFAVTCHDFGAHMTVVLPVELTPHQHVCCFALGFQAPGPASLSSSCWQQATWPWALRPADGHFTGILLVPSQPTCLLLLVCVSSSFEEEEVKQRVGELLSLEIYALLSPHLQLPCQLAHCSLASLLSFSEKCPSQFDPYYFFLGAACRVLGSLPLFLLQILRPLLLAVKGSGVPTLAIFVCSWVLSLSLLPHVLAMSAHIHLFPVLAVWTAAVVTRSLLQIPL